MLKKVLSIVLILMLLVAMSASAAGSKHQATENLEAAFTAQDIKYTFVGTDGDDDQLRSSWSDDHLGSVTVNIFINSTGSVSYRIWNVVDFSCGLNYAYQVCNDLNADYKFAKFYVDTSDNSITVSADMKINPDHDDSDACIDMLRLLLAIVDSAGETLLKMK